MIDRVGILKLLELIWSNTATKDRVRLFFVIIIVVLSSISEIASIGMLIPLVSVLIDPDSIGKFASFGLGSFESISFNNVQSIILLFLFILTLSSVVRIYSIKLSADFSFDIGATLSNKVFRSILHRDYIEYKKINTSEDIARIATKVNVVIQSLLFPAVMLLGAFLMLLLIFSFFLILNPKVTLSVSLLICSIYLLIMFYFSKKLKLNSRFIASLQNQQIKNIKECLGSIRDIIITNSHDYFQKIYYKNEQVLRRSQASNIVVAQSPRYLIELMAMFVILMYLFFISKENDDSLSNVLPALIAVVVAMQRMLPIAQQLYRSWANIIGNKDSLYDVLIVLKNESVSNHKAKLTKRISFNHFIELKDVCFSYPDSSSQAISHVNMVLNKGEKVGVVGKSGSGKSTLLDIILGLIQPTSGKMYVDGMPVDTNNVFSWYDNISHVPQTIYLLDEPLNSNIIFASNEGVLSKEKYVQVINDALVCDFIDSDDIYSNKSLGDQGGSISGGQRQRVGIARGLYKGGSILILDEATSALDEYTEQEIMKNICSKSDLTVVAISHNLSALKYCDRIIEMESGKVINSFDRKNKI